MPAISAKNEAKIRIAFVISSNLREWAGMEFTLYEYWRHAPDDVDITIFQNDYNPNPRLSQENIDELFSAAKIRTYKAYFSKLGFLGTSMVGKVLNEIFLTPLLAFLLRYTLLRKFRNEKNNFDIFYFFNSNVEPKVIGRKKGVLIGSTHAWFPSNSNMFKRLELKLLEDGLLMSSLDYIHFHPALYSLLNASHSRRFFSLPNGVDSRKYFPNKFKQTGPIRFLFNARLEECKGVIRVIEAFKTLNINMDASLDIVGSGKLSNAVQQDASYNIRYHGFVSDEELQRIVRECDILVYPSVCDSFGLVVLNSLSAGLHVITTEAIAGNFKPFLETGFVTVAGIDKNELVTAMQNCADNIDVIRNNREMGHKIAVANFNWDYVASSLYKIIKSIYYTEHPQIT